MLLVVVGMRVCVLVPMLMEVVSGAVVTTSPSVGTLLKLRIGVIIRGPWSSLCAPMSRVIPLGCPTLEEVELIAPVSWFSDPYR